MKIIKKIRLKKDTPDHRAGELFVLMSNNGIYEIDAGEDDPSVFYGGDIKNFDEWFEEVSDKWPQKDDAFWSISSDGTSFLDSWHNYTDGRRKMAIGNVFKTREAADRFVDYLKAITTVRQDEGVLMPEKVRETLNQGGTVYTVGTNATALSVNHFYNASAGAVYFDTLYNANTSIGNHLDEWTIITNYDWSRE